MVKAKFKVEELQFEFKNNLYIFSMVVNRQIILISFTFSILFRLKLNTPSFFLIWRSFLEYQKFLQQPVNKVCEFNSAHALEVLKKTQEAQLGELHVRECRKIFSVFVLRLSEFSR
jgi:hypothetical protein